MRTLCSAAATVAQVAEYRNQDGEAEHTADHRNDPADEPVRLPAADACHRLPWLRLLDHEAGKGRCRAASRDARYPRIGSRLRHGNQRLPAGKRWEHEPNAIARCRLKCISTCVPRAENRVFHNCVGDVRRASGRNVIDVVGANDEAGRNDQRNAANEKGADCHRLAPHLNVTAAHV